MQNLLIYVCPYELCSCNRASKLLLYLAYDFVAALNVST